MAIKANSGTKEGMGKAVKNTLSKYQIPGNSTASDKYIKRGFSFSFDDLAKSASLILEFYMKGYVSFD